jgi:transcriptional regulator with GAF, ATPase, and Fis domain
MGGAFVDMPRRLTVLWVWQRRHRCCQPKNGALVPNEPFRVQLPSPSLVLFSRGSVVGPDDLPSVLQNVRRDTPAGLFEDLPSLEEVERRYLEHVLQAVGRNRTRAADVLGIDRRTLYRMAERFGIKLGDEA